MVRLRMITLLCSRMRNPPSKISASSSAPMMDLSEVTSIVSPNGSISMVPSTRMVYGSSASAYSASSSCVVTVTVSCRAARGAVQSLAGKGRKTDRLVGPLGCGDLGGDLLTGGGLLGRVVGIGGEHLPHAKRKSTDAEEGGTLDPTLL